MSVYILDTEKGQWYRLKRTWFGNLKLQKIGQAAPPAWALKNDCLVKVKALGSLDGV